MRCPRCRLTLGVVRGRGGAAWGCPGCEGRALTLAVLRRAAPRELVNALWWRAQAPETPPGPSCPQCGRGMREVDTLASRGVDALDVCPACQLVWFDAEELEAVPAPPAAPPPDRPPLSREAAEALVRFELEHHREMQAAQRDVGALPFSDDAPTGAWKHLPALLGLPVEYDERPTAARPYVTWGLLVAVSAASLLALGNIEQVARTWGFLPDDIFRHGGLNILTAFFLHADVMHLVTNLYFLWVFGDDVEAWLSRPRYVLLLLAATVGGDLLHAVLASQDLTLRGATSAPLPVVGSSGGISGILVFYALTFPRARLGVLVHLLFWVRVPVLVYVVLWVLLQLLGAWGAPSGVAYGAHLGGGAVGALAWWAWRKSGRARG